MPTPVYNDIPAAAVLRSRLQALDKARTELQATDARAVLAVSLGPRPSAVPGIPNDTIDLEIKVGTAHQEWPAEIGLPATFKAAMLAALISWLSSEITQVRTDMTALGADLTGAPT